MYTLVLCITSRSDTKQLTVTIRIFMMMMMMLVPCAILRRSPRRSHRVKSRLLELSCKKKITHQVTDWIDHALIYSFGLVLFSYVMLYFTNSSTVVSCYIGDCCFSVLPKNSEN